MLKNYKRAVGMLSKRKKREFIPLFKKNKI